MEIQEREVLPNDDEMRNLGNFRKPLPEIDSSYDGHGSLAVQVARMAGFLDSTGVWAVTPPMGQVLRHLSSAFAKEWEKTFPQEIRLELSVGDNSSYKVL